MTNLLELYHTLPIPMRSVAASLRGYYLRWWRYGHNTSVLIEEARERESWSKKQWEVWKENRISFLLDHAARHVPYYQEYWAKRKQKGDNSSFAYLENWPVLNKEFVRRSPKMFVSDLSNNRKLFIDHTSGTSGTPLSIYLDRETLQKWYALFEARIRNWNSVSCNERWSIMGGQLVVPYEQKKPPFWVHNSAMNQLYLSTYHISERNAAHYVNILNEFQPTHMIVYPSSAAALAYMMLEQKLTPPQIKVIFSNAEFLSDAQRAIIQEAFRCKVVNTYGMGEYVIGASECINANMHFWPETGHIEVFKDEEDIPELRNTSGRFVITGLLNINMPLIRYDTGDRGRIGEEKNCNCGVNLPIINSLEGRSTDMIITKDGRKIFWLNPVFYGLPFREVQVVQESINTIVIRYIASEQLTDEHKRIVNDRMGKRLGDMNIVMEEVKQIPRSANGKFRAVISKIGKHEYQ